MKKRRLKNYKQLVYRDRVIISRLKVSGLSLSEIARRLRVHKSTVSRELKRNSHYSYWKAEDAEKIRSARASQANKIRCGKSPELINWVKLKLNLGWSPEQIAGRSKIDGPDVLCTETVYQIVRRDRMEGGCLSHLLKRFRKRKSRFPERKYVKRVIIPARRDIDERPKIVEKRKRLGDLEGDLIVGYKQSGYVVTVVDRASLRVALKKVQQKSKLEVSMALNKALKKLGHSHTITFDNGCEFAGHQKLTKQTGVKVFFAHPYASYERGTVENTNGLIRYYLPKKTSFINLTPGKMTQIEDQLNTRPRKKLNFLTPNEVHLTRKRPTKKRCT
jgi:IS30 family transposase